MMTTMMMMIVMTQKYVKYETGTNMNFVDDSKVKTAKIVQMEFKSWLNSSDNNQTN